MKVRSLLALLVQKYAVYLIYWYKKGALGKGDADGTQFTCFTGTKVQIPDKLSAAAEARRSLVACDGVGAGGT